jgi:hypothetical protein
VIVYILSAILLTHDLYHPYGQLGKLVVKKIVNKWFDNVSIISSMHLRPTQQSLLRIAPAAILLIAVAVAVAVI